VNVAAATQGPGLGRAVDPGDPLSAVAGDHQPIRVDRDGAGIVFGEGHRPDQRTVEDDELAGVHLDAAASASTLVGRARYAGERLDIVIVDDDPVGADRDPAGVAGTEGGRPDRATRADLNRLGPDVDRTAGAGRTPIGRTADRRRDVRARPDDHQVARQHGRWGRTRRPRG
jgi:hypothetical protein